MSLAITHSRATVGIQAVPVTVETHLARGLPRLHIVGLAEKAVKESKDRVRSALVNCDFKPPTRAITINLAPADLPKEGGRFDLPIALGILAASGQIDHHLLDACEFVGELALSGELRPVQGVLPIALQCKAEGRILFVPKANALEASLPNDVCVYGCDHLLEIIAYLNGEGNLKPYKSDHPTHKPPYPDFIDVRGHARARRALEIAASGQHSVLMSGSPGTGKTMLASRLPSILPDMTDSEALDSAAVLSIHGKHPVYKTWRTRIFRNPHHTASAPALVGGGNPPKPGEISLAHHGVLFLDELPEFSRHVLETLREPMESGIITIARAANSSQFPARFQFIGAMNPCPCGYLGDNKRQCRCTPEQIKRYCAKLSGPLLDRIDMHLDIPAISMTELTQQNYAPGESSAIIKQRVDATRMRQINRQALANAQLSGELLHQYCPLTDKTQQFMLQAMEKLHLSARAYHRILRLARTIADIANSDTLAEEHLAEAISFRPSPLLFDEAAQGAYV